MKKLEGLIYIVGELAKEVAVYLLKKWIEDKDRNK